ncbi:MAG: cobalt transporter CbiM, partial [Planctomycetes bacterium]|nr:cobalt transporter CbiM [Planctomycetota bacterium]
MTGPCLPLWAVHISEGVLTGPWVTGGFVVAGLLALVGAWRVRDEEIPQIALLTAAFFVVSLIHVKAGPTSVHLLFNGLVGVVLGRRACLAIPLGVFLQAALFGHGGFSTLGINSCIMALPALLAWQMFTVLQRLPWVRRPWFRGGLVTVSVLVWEVSLIYMLVLLFSNPWQPVSKMDYSLALRITGHPLTLIVALLLSVLIAWGERRLENAPEFPIGLLVGVTAVLATVLLNCLVLIWGGQEDWPSLVFLVVLPHLFIAVVEGVVLGFTVGFLVKVKPELLGWMVP